MNSRALRSALAGLLALATGGIGYAAGTNTAPRTISIPDQTVAAPPAGSIRVLYSLEKKQNDQQLIAIINGAQKYIYFAIYEFTLSDVGDALIAAKARGVDVEGIVDSGESVKTYDAKVIDQLRAAGIPIETEHHPGGKGIMHIKALATDNAYALGSYNWTASATNDNDELLEIGTDPTMVGIYTDILRNLLAKYRQ